MALNENIKKVILTPQEFLGVNPVIVPTTTSNDPYQAVRYRIISEDKTRASHWSPTFKVPLPTFSPNTAKVAFTGINNVINTALLNWTSPSTKFKSFNIFVEWSSNGGSTWTAPAYSGTSNSNNYSLAVPSTYDHIKLTVQVASIDIISYNGNAIPLSVGTPAYNTDLVVATTGDIHIT